MKRKSRQILAILLVLVTCISTMDISAFAAGINGLEQPQTEETTSDEALISMGDVATEGADGNDWDGTTT